MRRMAKNNCKKIVILFFTSQVLLIGFLYRWNNSKRSFPKHPNTIRYPETRLQSISSLAEQNVDTYQAKIAIGLAITTRKRKPNFALENVPFFHSLLPSFCMTCSLGYAYSFFLAYDYNDPLLSNSSFRTSFRTLFSTYVTSNCPRYSNVTLNYVLCEHAQKPAWAQNDAMMAAYLSGMEYFYRINDDTILETPRWTEIFIDNLMKMNPPLVGVVGPRHTGGNLRILTYDFTHRTHIDIHGFYYPRVFTTWYADDWITEVYRPDHSLKLRTVHLRHTSEQGRRYNKSKIGRSKINSIIALGKRSVMKYLNAFTRGSIPPDPRKIVAMLTSADDPDQLWGSVRNTLLIPVYLPNWTPRFYIINNSKNLQNVSSLENKPFHKEQILALLKQLGAQVIFVNNGTLPKSAPVIGCQYLVADDPTVDAFLIRDPRSRLGEREATSVSEWMNQTDEAKAVICMKAEEQHTKHNIVDGLWGARTKPLRSLLHGKTMYDLLTDFRNKTQPDNFRYENFAQIFLDKVLWERVRYNTICMSRFENISQEISEDILSGSSGALIGEKLNAYELPLVQGASE